MLKFLGRSLDYEKGEKMKANFTKEEFLNKFKSEEESDLKAFLLTNIFSEFMKMWNLDLREIDRVLISVLKLCKNHMPDYYYDDEFIAKTSTTFIVNMFHLFCINRMSIYEEHEKEIWNDVYKSLKSVRNAEKKATIRNILTNEDGNILPISEIVEITGLPRHRVKEIIESLSKEEAFLSDLEG
jgi:hypothetical protein